MVDDDRVKWNAFKKEHKAIYPLVSKLDKKYYQRLRIVYKAQRDCVQTLDPWLISQPATDNGERPRCIPWKRQKNTRF